MPIGGEDGQAKNAQTASTWVPTRPAFIAGAAMDARVVLLATDGVRFSQTTITSPTRLKGVIITLSDLVETFRRDGYVSDPIEVVPMSDGELTSLDNRRLWAAQQAGLESIHAIILRPTQQPTSHLRRSLKLDRDLVDERGEVGPAGELLFLAKSFPATVEQAVVFRCYLQFERTGVKGYPLLGSLEQPQFLGERKPPHLPDNKPDQASGSRASGFEHGWRDAVSNLPIGQSRGSGRAQVRQIRRETGGMER